MTALTKDQIPSYITTVEGLHAWTAAVLKSCYTDLKCVELLDVNATPIDREVVTLDPFYVTATKPGAHRLIIRASLPLKASYLFNGPFYKGNVGLLGDADIPSGFTQ